MKNQIQFLAGALLMTSVVGTGLSYAAGTQNQKENAAQDRRVQHSENLAKSKKDMGFISTGIDGLLLTVREAAATNNKGKMKAALVASEKHLIEMKTHSDNCMKNMESMDMDMSMDGRMEGRTSENAQ